MTLTDLASLGSFISGLAVLVSLIYLSLQIRQNTLAHRATAHKVRADFVMHWLDNLLDPSLASTFVRGAAGDESLTEGEFTQFQVCLHSWFVGLSEMYWLHDRGVLDEDAFAGSTMALRAYLQTPGVRAVWPIIAPVMPAHFRLSVERLLVETTPAPFVKPFDTWKAALRAQSGKAAP
jgi:hypothetical protein